MIKRILKTSIFSVGSRGFLTLTNLVIMYSVSRHLGGDKLGIYGITTFFYYLFAYIISFELTTYFGKEIAFRRDNEDQLKRLYGEMALSHIIGLAVGVAVLLNLVLFYHRIETPLMVLSCISGLIFGLEKNLSGALLGKEKMHFELISQVIAAFIVALPVFFLIKKLDIAGVYYLRIAASAITVCFRNHVTGAAKYLERKFLRPENTNWKEMSFFAASGLSYFVQHHIDLFILSFLISNKEEAAYFLALRIFLSFNLLAEMFSFALTPFISRSYRQKEEEIPGTKKTEPGQETGGRFQAFYARMLAVKIALAAAAALTLFFTRHLIVEFFDKEGEAAQATDFLAYFSILVFFRFVSYYTGNVLSATRYQDIRFYILTGSATLMILLEFLLGNLFSVHGVIIARGAVEVLIFTAYLTAVTVVRRREKVQDKR